VDPLTVFSAVHVGGVDGMNASETLAGGRNATVTITRAATSSPSSSYTSYYKVYSRSSDSTAPTLFWNNPAEGQTITGRSFTVTVSSSDDHAVMQIA
jgi:hypothetical protein